ncbi:MAG: 3-hydroxyacyl-CoA dehydrogenase NAD-binding domain-containing protein [Litorilinea sp.]
MSTDRKPAPAAGREPAPAQTAPTPIKNANIKTATVIGAGTMGAAIAAHLANAGLTVYLLDMAAPDEPAPDASGDTPADAPAEHAPRNRIVAAGFERMRSARPAHLYTPQLAQNITLGNLEDDLDACVGRSDWIIEAIVEKLEPKQALMARIEAAAPAHAIISTNTSGLLIAAITAGRSADFARRFLGAHFFNPPRYLYLLELIPTPATDPAIVQQLRTFAIHSLGKGVVICRDTPNFIANRMISYIISQTLEFAVERGYTVDEVDYLAGPLIGRPRSGLFRLLDVIGIDVMAQINRNLYTLIAHDPDRDALQAPLHTAAWDTLIAAGHLGSKRGQGFYKTVTDDEGTRAFWTLDLQAARAGTVDYHPPQTPDFPALHALRRAPLVERLRAILAQFDTDPQDRGAALVWHTVAHALVYAARRLPEIADSIVDIDRAMRWGFIWEMGPFELWDALGVADTAARMTASGIEPPAWVGEMLAQGHTSFYTTEDTDAWVYDPTRTTYVPVAGDSVRWDMPAIHRKGKAVYANDSATVHLVPGTETTPQPMLLLEFHSKLNALDPGSLDALEAARDALLEGTGNTDQRPTGNDGTSVAGLLIANAGVHFCVGANLQHMLDAAQAQDWDTLSKFIQRGQYLFLDLRRAARPVVAAPFQRVLGGGVEVCLAAQRVVAQAETYLGLVETSVGLIPGWGGCKELTRRHVYPGADSHAMPAGLERIFDTIVGARVSTSAHDAQRLGLLDPDDIVAMNPMRLIETARAQLYALAAQPRPKNAAAQVYAAGRAGRALLDARIEDRQSRGQFTDYDCAIAHQLAHVLCGDGDAGWQPEETFLEREREAFVRLAGEPNTQARMAHMLRTGKPLRN